MWPFHISRACSLIMVEIIVWQLTASKASFPVCKVKAPLIFFDLALEVICVTLLHSVGYQKIINQHKFKRRAHCSKVCGMGATVSAFLKNTVF